ncbi:NAD(P)/FAD-dependent oxidoreductase [Verminephrobacter aporrectodeae]|uniref:NAD(P)/FAD-dependent oxidoreductase n=1 Tax=Verminephrobacter aporrectodeae TaxID=1110389 RepID=UPI00223905F5|nr:FAD-binding oxidoreductase [Verminephrobacter aporrectodeae]MCW5220763.1 FAD-binding oxidoreductase [Verminephrobacter aporrectodeae subsp. tuberculatae]MCW5255285.1 FAD-binding oxidoreductase [Verminephrobacter aporrectodeae subsp. tuberculatae]MCW5290058.1 FAD-binding oxidoreductase [Verminephrobacter aporrectodeae subsp. tuberculatae]MCW8176946.1 FAD-binding oxidoreductase [Verminephrobacter aporrectodeae subsp. tuberculatae]MCW8204424.1 FAD-binding oxidoreductase [Verminephrobacter apor
MENYDAIVIGAGVIGSSVAYHLARQGCRRVLVLDRNQVGAGTTSQSSGILRTHYSVVQNVELAKASWQVFKNFAGYLGDDEASAGLVKCGYLIAAPNGDKLEPLRSALANQAAMGIEVRLLGRDEARSLLPIARFDDAALIGYEPEAGFADAYLVATAFARAARRLGVTIREDVEAQQLLVEAGRVVGVETSKGRFLSDTVISTQNIWARDIERWTGIASHVSAERHSVFALEGPEAYTFQMPVYKDLGSPGMLYCRSYGGKQMLVSEGIVGEKLPSADNEQGDISMDYMIEVGEQVANRFPSFETAGVASSWTGVYDVTPDWNPVLGRLPDISGLVVGYGFSGHGFKLSPAVGKILAQEALGITTDIELAPYALERFRAGHLLTGKYGSGAVS